MDALAKLPSIKALSGNRLIMLTLLVERNDFTCIDEKEEQMDPIKAYLKNETLSEDKRQVEKVKK